MLFCCLTILSQFLLAQSLPTTFDPGRRDPQTDEITGTSSNVRWAVRIGSPTYSTPVIVNGKVLIGTLNNARYDDRRDRGRSVLLCFDDRSGKFLWQLALPKDYRIPYFDSFCVGISSNPTVIGNRAFLATGRGEILCIDLNGMGDGNDGPFRDEAGFYMFNDDERKPFELNDKDADIVWRYDVFRELKSKPHDTNNCEIVFYSEQGNSVYGPKPRSISGGLLIVNTANSPDYSHENIPNPEAPSLIIMDAESGRPLARDDFDIGCDISHGQWSSPAFAKVRNEDGNLRNMIFYGGGNGCLYAVEAPAGEKLFKRYNEHLKTGKRKPGEELPRLKTTWKFQGDPRGQPGSKEPIPPFVTAMGSPSYTCLPPPAFDNLQDAERIFMVFGHDAWNGAKPLRSWLACIDAKTGNQKVFWGTDNIEGGAVAPPTIDEGFVYLADRKGRFYCFDGKSGKEIWKVQLKGDIWAKPLVADGKIYVGTDRRMFYTLRKGTKPEILSAILMPDRIFAPAAAHGNTLYVVGEGFLYAVETTH